MQQITVGNLQDILTKHITSKLNLSVMMWGKPGIGKSQAVAGAAQAGNLTMIDVRIGQLAPTDLRGLPFKTDAYFVRPLAAKIDEAIDRAETARVKRARKIEDIGGPEGYTELLEAAGARFPTPSQLKLLEVGLQSGLVVRDAVAGYAAPDFLPRTDGHVLFLDEFNQGTPAIMAICQQLILDRQVGSYRVPDGVPIWAAGNRKEDRAAVNEMQTPVANRFVHYDVVHNVDEWVTWALQQGLDPSFPAFVGFKPELMHRMERGQMAWPSPRSWAMAAELKRAGMNIDAAVGAGPGSEYEAFARIYDRLPDAVDIVEGRYKGDFPDDISEQWAATTAVTSKVKEPRHFVNAMRWIDTREMRQVLCSVVIPMIDKSPNSADFYRAIKNDSEIMETMKQNVRSMNMI